MNGPAPVRDELQGSETYGRVVVVVLAEGSLNGLRDCWLVICQQRCVSGYRDTRQARNLTERDVGEEVVCDVVMSDLQPKECQALRRLELGRFG